MMVTVIETCSKLYIVEYSVVFWLNDFLVSTKTQWDGSYKKKWPVTLTSSVLGSNVSNERSAFISRGQGVQE